MQFSDRKWSRDWRTVFFGLALFLTAQFLGTKVCSAEDTQSSLQSLYDAQGDLAAVVLNSDQVFVQGSRRLTSEGQNILAQLSQKLGNESGLQFSVYAHSQDGGYPAMDRRLSGQQANAVKDTLVGLGLSSSRFDTVRGMSGTGRLMPGERPGTNWVELSIAGRVPVAGAVAAAGTSASASGVQSDDQSQAAGTAPTNSVQSGDQALASNVTTTSTVAQDDASEPLRYAVGVGYPDLRLRANLDFGLAVEAKYAYEPGIDIYSGRLYWNFWSVGPLAVEVGAEGGYARFSGTDILNGNGSYGEGFLGLEYTVTPRIKLSVDAGPARIQARSYGYTYNTTDLIFNTAVYLYLF